ncbi:MAG: hypothetical protein LBI28_04550 [Treponema sp.]|jgi:hypothetical protein|nr:hypothetical protein [Treponema sp.]
MLNTIKLTAAIVFTAIIAFALAGCAKGDDPKALAKQIYDINQEITAAANDSERLAELKKTLENLEGKMKKLSPADEISYQLEAARLKASEAGSAFGDLLDSAGSSTQDDADLQGILKGLLGN